LPPYVFATINDLRDVGRRSGRDVIDLGFGNPDLPSPDVAVEKLAESVRNPRNHRYSGGLRTIGAGCEHERSLCGRKMELRPCFWSPRARYGMLRAI